MLWSVIMIASTGLAVYSSTSIYLAWQEAPVLTTFGSDILPIHNLDFPSVILCSPGNNMAALPNISHILSDEWEAFWQERDSQVLDDFNDMDEAVQKKLITTFVRNHIPGWPEDLTLESFMLHMTTHFPALRRTILLWEKEPAFRNSNVPVFDLLLNPDRSKELELELERIDQKSKDLFQNLDFSEEKHHKVMLSVLWFTAQPCRQLLRSCHWKGQRIPCEKIFYPIPTGSTTFFRPTYFRLKCCRPINKPVANLINIFRS